MASTYKILGQSNPSATSLTDVYTVPSKSTIISSVIVCNRSATATTFRLAFAPGGAVDDAKHYVAYDAPLQANEVWCFTIGATLSTTDVVRIYATNATVSVNLFGEEIY